MSYYRDSGGDITLYHTQPGPLTATVYYGGDVVGEPERFVTSINMGSNYAHTFPLMASDCKYDGEVVIVWRGTNFEHKNGVEVVTPIVPFGRLSAAFPDRAGDDDFFQELESSIRLIIEAYTGTKFEYFKGSVSVHATNSSLVLPTKAIDIYDIPGLSSYRLSPNKKIVVAVGDEYLSIKQAPPEEFRFSTYGVITVPGYYRKIRTGNVYDIYGEFGYLSVPEDVQEAAMLLANDFVCNDGIYRDKFISTVKTELTNYTFDPRAFTGTGNARVDLLLSKYKAEGYAWL